MRTRLSLRYRIAISVFLVTGAVMAVMLWQTLGLAMDASRKQLAETESVVLDMLSDLTRVALITEEYADLQPYIERVQEDRRITQILVTDTRGRVVASSIPDLVGLATPEMIRDSERYWRTRRIQNPAGPLGSLAIQFSTATLATARDRALELGISIAVLGMLVIAILGTLLGYLLTRRLGQLTIAAQRLAGGNLSVRSNLRGGDEVGKLGTAFDNMAAAIEREVQLVNESRERFSLAVQATHDGIWDWNIKTGEIYFSPRCREMLGYEESDFDDNFLSWQALVHPDDLGRVLEIWARYMDGQVDQYTLEYRLRTKQGDYIWVESQGTASNDDQGEVVRITGSLTDITRQREQAAALEHQALHDALTSLPNRVLFNDRIDHAIASAHRDETQLAVMMMDLDRFKDINDTLGHHMGDLLLQQVAERLHALLRESDTVARLGGDEFAILLPHTDMSHVMAVAQKIDQALDAPFLLDTHDVDVGVSIGIALYPEHGETPQILLQRSDVAMYMAKQGNLTTAIYNVEEDPHSLHQLTLVTELRRGIKEEQLVLRYQPMVDIANESVIGVEALARWQHPHLGLLSPDRFIPVAEKTGLIKPLTEWVLNAALYQVASWYQNGIELIMSVNLSAHNLQDAKLAGLVSRLLHSWQIPPALLQLEITESAIMVDPERAGETLARLDEMGVRLAIDDFGTGYSSLVNLRQLPVDELKIDKSFVMNMQDNENDAVIVRSTIDLAHNLGLSVVAEGVEDRDVWNLLNLLDCNVAQGYYLSKPLDAETVVDWLTQSPFEFKHAHPVSIANRGT